MRKINGNKNLMGTYIKVQRETKKLNRNDLAKQLQLLGINMTIDDIYRIETNRVMIKDFELAAIAEVLGFDLNIAKKLLKS